VALLAVLGAVGANAGAQAAVTAARADRAEARAERDAAVAQRDLATALAAFTDAATTRAAAAADGARARAQTLARATKRVGAEVDTTRTDLATAGSEVAAAAGRFDEARAVLDTLTGQVDDLRTCVGGVAAATADPGDTDAVTAAMQAVADPCRRAQAATGAVDPTARFPYDFPDPFVVAAGGGYYAYATNSAGGAVQLLRSGDLQTWAFAGTALDGVPGWAVPGATWAPAVLAAPDGNGWALYYAVRHADSGRQCISAAWSAGPAGPFVDGSTRPLVCELGQGGSIDPSPFVGPDGAPYLLWKSEGEVVGGGAAIRAQRLDADGLGLAGDGPATLAAVDQGWEGRTVEGPSMAMTGSGLLLLYSANRWDTAGYGVGAAWCSSPLGPCEKVPGPVLGTGGAMVGPGGAEAFVDGSGQLRVAFHAWQGEEVGYPNARLLHIGTLTASGAGVAIRP
jgi:hypothetical protein